MTEIVKVRFRGKGKAYTFAANGVTARPGDKLVVETSKGMDMGDCVEGNMMAEEDPLVQPLRPVIRAATAGDLRVAEINRAREKEALGICEEKIREHGLDMKLVDVECAFEGNKILFFFTADGRVDFRALVKDLASVFRTRIELRQIGVRDEAKMMGGLGICGRPFCCSQFMDEFLPVSTKMAKTQSMSLNPSKISGVCGRLMCCLRYEQDTYEELIRHSPRNGAFVETEDGYGNVTAVNLLKQSVRVKMDGTSEPVFHNYPIDEIAEIPGGRPPAGEPLPHLLKPKEKKKEEPEEDPWSIPILIPEDFPAESTTEAPAPAAPAGSSAAKRRRRKKKSGGQTPPAEERPKKAEAAAAKPAEKAENRPQQKKNPGRPVQSGPTAPGGGHPVAKRRRRPRGNRNGGSGATGPKE